MDDIRPVWTEGGVPANLNAAARDAYEWLLLIRRCHEAGRWKFSQRDTRQRLDGCIDALGEQIASGG